MVLPPIVATKIDNTGTATQAAPGLAFPSAATIRQDITIQGQNGSPVDLTGSAVILTICTKAEGALILKNQAIIDVAASGRCHFLISGTQTLGLRGAFLYDVELVDSQNNTDQIIPVSSLFITDALYDPDVPISVLAAQVPLGEGPPGLGQIQCPPGTGLTQRSAVSVDGSFLLAVDNPAQNRTDLSFAAAPAFSSFSFSGSLRGTGPSLLGLFGVTPVPQQSTTGTTTGFSAASGSNVLSGSTFTGGLGTTAYTIGDIVRALKLYGLLLL